MSPFLARLLWGTKPSSTSRCCRRKQRGRRLEAELLEDRIALTTFIVNNSADDGAPGTLRDAITALNADLTASYFSPHVIEFDVAGDPAITLLSALPRWITSSSSTAVPRRG